MELAPAPRELSILYRGPLSSCNYDCGYCPFAKHHETSAELAVDRAALERLLSWIESRADLRLRLLFTPWGEALTRPWYRDAILAMSHWPHVAKVAAQTNLSGPLDWLGRCHVASIGLWCTFHPTQTTRADFLDRCRQLDRLGVSYSVGVVGLREHWEHAVALREALPPRVYLWVNAFKSEGDYYTVEEAAEWERIDPLFPVNNQRHRSLGQACRTGQDVISVDGAGDVRRCHFVPALLGNLYRDPLESMLRPRLCPNAACGCHIGYVHLPSLGLHERFGEGILERVLSDRPQPRLAEREH